MACYKDKLALNNADSTIGFPVDNIIIVLFKCKQKLMVQTAADGTKDVEIIIVPFKYLINFWGTPEIPLIICEINLILTCFSSCVISSGTATNQAITFTITDTRHYVIIVTLSTHDSAKPLQQFKSGFKRIINWNKCKAKLIERQNQYNVYRLIN